MASMAFFRAVFWARNQDLICLCGSGRMVGAYQVSLTPTQTVNAVSFTLGNLYQGIISCSAFTTNSYPVTSEQSDSFFSLLDFSLSSLPHSPAYFLLPCLVISSETSLHLHPVISFVLLPAFHPVSSGKLRFSYVSSLLSSCLFFWPFLFPSLFP